MTTANDALEVTAKCLYKAVRAGQPYMRKWEDVEDPARMSWMKEAAKLLRSIGPLITEPAEGNK